MMAEIDEPLLLEEAAARFHISISLLRKWIADGKLRRGWQHGGGKRRRSVVRADEVEQLIEQSKKGQVIWDEK